MFKGQSVKTRNTPWRSALLFLAHFFVWLAFSHSTYLSLTDGDWFLRVFLPWFYTSYPFSVFTGLSRILYEFFSRLWLRVTLPCVIRVEHLGFLRVFHPGFLAGFPSPVFTSFPSRVSRVFRPASEVEISE